MPYSPTDVKSLPSNVQKMTPAQRKKWCSTWNSVYGDCIKDGGKKDDCESKAFRIANGTVKKAR